MAFRTQILIFPPLKTWLSGQNRKAMNKFTNFPLGTSFLEKLAIIYWRLRGCDHNTNAYLDIGDEDHAYWYCFRCGTRT